MLHHYIPTRNLRSSNSLLLSPHPAKTNFGLHAFHSAAPNIWNKLPINVKSARSISSFKAHLKTHYFQLTSWLVTWPRASDSLATFGLCAPYKLLFSFLHAISWYNVPWIQLRKTLNTPKLEEPNSYFKLNLTLEKPLKLNAKSSFKLNSF